MDHLLQRQIELENPPTPLGVMVCETFPFPGPALPGKVEGGPFPGPAVSAGGDGNYHGRRTLFFHEGFSLHSIASARPQMAPRCAPEAPGSVLGALSLSAPPIIDKGVGGYGVSLQNLHALPSPVSLVDGGWGGLRTRLPPVTLVGQVPR